MNIFMINADSRTRVVSFDLEGTLITPDFSYAVWSEAIPRLYALSRGIDIEKARVEVFSAYREIGEQRLEWYDIRYWFKRFGLGDYRQVMEDCRHLARPYPEVAEVVSRLTRRFQVIIASNSSRDFMDYLISPLPEAFSRVFSSVSDFGQVKKPPFYLEVCRILGVEPGEVLHVGDSWEFDVCAAQDAGMEALYLNREGKSTVPDSLASLRDLETRLL